MLLQETQDRVGCSPLKILKFIWVDRQATEITVPSAMPGEIQVI